MSTGTQQSAADADYAAVEIETHGRIARSFIELCDTVAGDEGVQLHVSDDETAGSLLSLDYLTEIADALTSAKMDALTIGFRDQHPIRLRYSRAEWGLSGEFWVAPRIESDDELGGDQP